MICRIDDDGAGRFRSVIGDLLAQEARINRFVRALWLKDLIVRRRVGIGHSPILLVTRIVLLWRGAKPLARPPLSLTSRFAEQEFDKSGHGIGR